MKKYAMWTMVGLMCMAPAAFAQDHSGHSTTTPPGGTAGTMGAADTTTPTKKADKRMAKGKHKKTKPLTAKERKEMETMQEISKDPNATGEERSEVK